jgi:ribosome-associated protein
MTVADRGPDQARPLGRALRHTGPMTSVPISDDSIRLGQFLKLADLADSGAHARALLEDGAVTVNGEDETRRGRQLVKGDVVEVDLPAGYKEATVG